MSDRKPVWLRNQNNISATNMMDAPQAIPHLGFSVATIAASEIMLYTILLQSQQQKPQFQAIAA